MPAHQDKDHLSTFCLVLQRKTRCGPLLARTDKHHLNISMRKFDARGNLWPNLLFSYDCCQCWSQQEAMWQQQKHAPIHICLNVVVSNQIASERVKPSGESWHKDQTGCCADLCNLNKPEAIISELSLSSSL